MTPEELRTLANYGKLSSYGHVSVKISELMSAANALESTQKELKCLQEQLQQGGSYSTGYTFEDKTEMAFRFYKMLEVKNSEIEELQKILNFYHLKIGILKDPFVYIRELAENWSKLGLRYGTELHMAITKDEAKFKTKEES